MIVFLAIILITALLLYGIVMAGALKPAAHRAKRAGTGRPVFNRADILSRWATIEAMSRTGGNGLRQAVSEADKLFDHVLKAKGFDGETMADRLRSAQSQLSDRNAVWQAHKLRNALAHEVGFDLVASQAQSALRGFERGLKDLGAL